MRVYIDYIITLFRAVLLIQLVREDDQCPLFSSVLSFFFSSQSQIQEYLDSVQSDLSRFHFQLGSMP